VVLPLAAVVAPALASWRGARMVLLVLVLAPLPRPRRAEAVARAPAAASATPAPPPLRPPPPALSARARWRPTTRPRPAWSTGEESARLRGGEVWRTTSRAFSARAREREGCGSISIENWVCSRGDVLEAQARVRRGRFVCGERERERCVPLLGGRAAAPPRRRSRSNANKKPPPPPTTPQHKSAATHLRARTFLARCSFQHQVRRLSARKKQQNTRAQV
jgi:hypothetical protein